MSNDAIAILPAVGWKDQDWAELLACMRRRKVIPVIGEELLQVEIEGKPVPLYTWMAERLASVLDVLASELPSPASLNDVACRYLARSDSNRNSIYMHLWIIMDEAKANLRAPMSLRQLAEITDFNLFLTTTFDSLMESALNEIRKKETLSLAYSPTDRQDLPAEKDHSRPTVYHLFGTLDVSPAYAISREDLFEWIYAMESQPRAVRQAMRWASDERRLAEACGAVLTFMHRHPIAATWGRSDLASSDMMSLETAKRVWQARLDPRRQTPSIGIYSHVRDRWGIFNAQPLVLNEQRQAGAAIEGVVRHEEIEIAQLAVDTHGYTDFAMALAKMLGFDLCPRLKALKDRHLFLPRGTEIPESVRAICLANVDLQRISTQWDQAVHLIASVHSGHTSAVHVTARYGSAARGDPLYEAVSHLGRLLRTVFLCDYFLNDVFRRELLRVLNRGEAVNALKRAIYTGRVSSHQAKQHEEMQAVADALSLLANILMAWNTAQMQQVLDHWAQRRDGSVPPELIGRIAPTRTEGIKLRGVFRFPFERYAEKILPSSAAEKMTASAS